MGHGDASIDSLASKPHRDATQGEHGGEEEEAEEEEEEEGDQACSRRCPCAQVSKEENDWGGWGSTHLSRIPSPPPTERVPHPRPDQSSFSRPCLRRTIGWSPSPPPPASPPPLRTPGPMLTRVLRFLPAEPTHGCPPSASYVLRFVAVQQMPVIICALRLSNIYSDIYLILIVLSCLLVMLRILCPQPQSPQSPQPRNNPLPHPQPPALRLPDPCLLEPPAVHPDPREGVRGLS